MLKIRNSNYWLFSTPHSSSNFCTIVNGWCKSYVCFRFIKIPSEKFHNPQVVNHPLCEEQFPILKKFCWQMDLSFYNIDDAGNFWLDQRVELVAVVIRHNRKMFNQFIHLNLTKWKGFFYFRSSQFYFLSSHSRKVWGLTTMALRRTPAPCWM